MKIALLSDLHMEFGSEMPEPIEGVDAHVLAGDINSGGARKTWDKLMRLWPQNVTAPIYIAGNHEFYGALANQDEGMEYTTVSIGYTSIIATTLWSNPDPRYAHCLNDFFEIKEMTPEVMSRKHSEQKKFLFDSINASIEMGMRKIVVVTHHLPSLECVLPRWKDSYLNSFFVSNTLEEIWQPEWAGKVVAWLYGHTHDKMDFMHSLGVRMVSNPHGYQNREVFEKAQWKVITV